MNINARSNRDESELFEFITNCGLDETLLSEHRDELRERVLAEFVGSANTVTLRRIESTNSAGQDTPHVTYVKLAACCVAMATCLSALIAVSGWRPPSMDDGSSIVSIDSQAEVDQEYLTAIATLQRFDDGVHTDTLFHGFAACQYEQQFRLNFRSGESHH